MFFSISIINIIIIGYGYGLNMFFDGRKLPQSNFRRAQHDMRESAHHFRFIERVMLTTWMLVGGSQTPTASSSTQHKLSVTFEIQYNQNASQQNAVYTTGCDSCSVVPRVACITRSLVYPAVFWLATTACMHKSKLYEHTRASVSCTHNMTCNVM